MDISPHNYVSVNAILADVLKTVKDGSFKLNSKGWYTSQIQQALEELSFDTFFDEQNQSFDLPDNLRLDMPKGSFNLRAIYLFNGDNCDIGKSVNVYYKRNFINSVDGRGYVAHDKYYNGNDPYHIRRGARRGEVDSPTSNADNRLDPKNAHFYAIQNGTIMLSENCKRFQKVMLVYNGIMADIGDTPIVPQLFRQAVKTFVLIPALVEKMTDTIGTNEYNHWALLSNKNEAKHNHPYDGTWVKAERRSKQLNNAIRRDIKEYLTKMNY